MFSKDMLRVYKRLLMLGFISASLFFLGFMDEPVRATELAPCMENCMMSEDMCLDSCAPSCSTDDANCNTCITNCQNQFMSCMRFAVSCPDVAITTSPACQIGFADHCPVVGGSANCSDPNAHSGFFQICTTISGNQCVSCPDHEFCTGSNGLPPCF